MADKTALSRTLTDGILGQLIGTSSPANIVEPLSRGFEILALNVLKAKSKHVSLTN